MVKKEIQIYNLFQCYYKSLVYSITIYDRWKKKFINTIQYQRLTGLTIGM